LEKIVSKALDGDSDAEMELFQSLRVRFIYLAKKRLLKSEDAEDIAQEACLTVLEKYRTADFHGNFTPWALKILRNKIGNHLQSKSVQVDREANRWDKRLSSGNTTRPADVDLIRAVVGCLRKLIVAFPRYARALNLAHQGYGTDEICRRLGIKSNNLYVILNRGRSFLKDCLGKET